jgi:hypothetical protein
MYKGNLYSECTKNNNITNQLELQKIQMVSGANLTSDLVCFSGAQRAAKDLAASSSILSSFALSAFLQFKPAE